MLLADYGKCLWLFKVLTVCLGGFVTCSRCTNVGLISLLHKIVHSRWVGKDYKLLKINYADHFRYFSHIHAYDNVHNRKCTQIHLHAHAHHHAPPRAYVYTHTHTRTRIKQTNERTDKKINKDKDTQIQADTSAHTDVYATCI